MADIFLKDDALKILKGKQIIFIGDSIQRNIYQDLVTLLCKGGVTSHDILKKKGEMIPEYLGDKLVNNTGQLTPGTEYREERELRLRRDGQDPPLAKFYFLTKCWSSHLKEFLVRYKEEHGSPDLILVLSCLWDINRWGSGGIAGYKTNCRDLLRHVKKHMSAKTQVIWLTSPPIAVECHGALMVEGMDKEGMRFNVMEANLMVATAAASFGYDVLDLHHMLMHQVHKRMPDGIHWTQAAVRFQVNLILTHFCLSRNIPLPRRDSSNFLRHAKRIADCALEGPVEIVKDRNENHDNNNKRKQQTTAGQLIKKRRL